MQGGWQGPTAVGEKRCRGAEPGGGEKGRLRGSKLSSAVCAAVAPADACCALRCASACSSGCLGIRRRGGEGPAHQKLQSSHAAAYS